MPPKTQKNRADSLNCLPYSSPYAKHPYGKWRNALFFIVGSGTSDAPFVGGDDLGAPLIPNSAFRIPNYSLVYFFFNLNELFLRRHSEFNRNNLAVFKVDNQA